MKCYKIICISILFVGTLFAQKADRLFELYEQRDIAGLKKALSTAGSSGLQKYDRLFFETLFNNQGEIAEKTYQKIFEKGSPRVKVLVARKLMDYYYAIGYYVTATKYQKYIVENKSHEPLKQDHPVVQKIPGVRYFIQVGAFSLYDNALQHVHFLKTQEVQAEVVEREVNSNKLFCVWIQGKSDLDNTLVFANKIKQKFDLEFQIMKK